MVGSISARCAYSVPLFFFGFFLRVSRVYFGFDDWSARVFQFPAPLPYACGCYSTYTMSKSLTEFLCRMRNLDAWPGLAPQFDGYCNHGLAIAGMPATTAAPQLRATRWVPRSTCRTKWTALCSTPTRGSTRKASATSRSSSSLASVSTTTTARTPHSLNTTTWVVLNVGRMMQTCARVGEGGGGFGIEAQESEL